MALMTKPLPPKGHCHYHRPVISFKEQLLVNLEPSAVSSALTAPSNLALQTALNFCKLLTAYRSPFTPKSPVGRSPLRLPLYKDPTAGAAGTCLIPKLRGTTNSPGQRRRRLPPRSFSAADESGLVPVCPSPTADRSSSFCQGTCAGPDPSRAKETVSVRWLPIPALDKCAR